MDDDLVAAYAAEAKAAMEAEANRRIAETTNPEEEQRLRNMSLIELVDSEHFVPALLSRLGAVRAALDGHGGGIAVSRCDLSNGLDIVLDLTGACLSCGAAPGTLEGVKPTWRTMTRSNAYASHPLFWTPLMNLGENLFLLMAQLNLLIFHRIQPGNEPSL